MRVLVACEFSGIVRDAFRARGHDAWSCDLLPTEADPQWHIQGDALVNAYIPRWWDLIIAHPPCTYLTNAGVRWLHTKPGRWEQMREAGQFFRDILEAPADRIAVENPVMHRYAVEFIGRKQDQVVQPWMHGHAESKGTGLWLKNLPLLVPTDNVREAAMALPARERDRVHHMSPGPNRWRERSRTFPGIARAMAEQWGAS
jgi:hypothetical protein